MFMQYDFQNSNLYEINKYKNKNYCCIIDSSLLNSNKFYFTGDSILHINKLTNFYLNDIKVRKTLNFHKNFKNSYFVYFSNFDIEKDFTYAIPLFECKEFICLSCNKVHNNKSFKCCSFSNSIILIKEATLISLYLCKADEFSNTLKMVKNEFLKLHFPDVLDKILLV